MATSLCNAGGVTTALLFPAASLAAGFLPRAFLVASLLSVADDELDAVSRGLLREGWCQDRPTMGLALYSCALPSWVASGLTRRPQCLTPHLFVSLSWPPMVLARWLWQQQP
ncbi:hypothetical protein BC831DRAFT_485805, partial [Entophlyctis helioformis]